MPPREPERAPPPHHTASMMIRFAARLPAVPRGPPPAARFHAGNPPPANMGPVTEAEFDVFLNNRIRENVEITRMFERRR